MTSGEDVHARAHPRPQPHKTHPGAPGLCGMAKITVQIPCSIHNRIQSAGALTSCPCSRRPRAAAPPACSVTLCQSHAAFASDTPAAIVLSWVGVMSARGCCADRTRHIVRSRPLDRTRDIVRSRLFRGGRSQQERRDAAAHLHWSAVTSDCRRRQVQGVRRAHHHRDKAACAHSKLLQHRLRAHFHENL
jgi:hypothetical protein